MNTEELRIYLRTIADTTGAERTQQALRATQQQANQSLTAVGVAAGVAAVAAQALANRVGDLVNIYASSIQTVRDHERVVRATSMAYGQAASDYQRFAAQLSATTGFTSDAILEAALSARTLSQNYGLTIQQTQQLIRVSADLARVRGIGVRESFERVQSAIRGEAEAAEYLGLTLNDTFLRNQAMNGSLRNTFERMTDAEKAQVRYAELLRQAGQFAGLAATQTDSLDTAFNKLATSTNKLQLVLGELFKGPTIGALKALTELMDIFAATGKDVNAERFGFFLRGLGDVFDKAKQGASLVDIIRDVQTAGEAANTAALKQVETRNLLLGQEREMARLRALNENVPPVMDLARVALMDQATAATRDMLALMQQNTDLQRQATFLSAEEARVKLSLLPAQQQMAALQRQITEQQLRARQAALPATEALEDLRFEQERARLIASNRRASGEERGGARRQLREISRALPAVELAALDAERSLVPGARAATRIGMQAQLLDLAGQGALAGIGGALQQNQLQQAITAGMLEAQRQILQDIAGQLTTPMTVTVNITHEDGRTTTYTELLEANAQASLPPIVPQSAVRR